jgi:hypothetical protein
MCWIDEDRGTCCCGHEVDVDARQCIVWDRHGQDHRVPDNRGACLCHDTPLRTLEARWPYL